MDEDSDEYMELANDLMVLDVFVSKIAKKSLTNICSRAIKAVGLRELVNRNNKLAMQEYIFGDHNKWSHINIWISVVIQTHGFIEKH